jgi:serine/threonine protein kinase
MAEAPSPLPEIVEPNRPFGRYLIVRTLGKGGMGTVYLAHDEQLDRPVALKIPHISPEDGPEVLGRFYREARAAANVHHPNICPVYDVGDIDGVPYLTMAFIDGRPLSELIRVGRHLPERQAAEIVQQIAVAMQEAHHRGVIHRDLKPANIHINQQGQPIVMDFGVARWMNHEGEQLTLSGRLVGTPEYMAPEQANGDPTAATPTSDIYSLGVILYRLLTGRLPFEGPMLKVLSKLVKEEPLPPGAYRHGLDPRLETICRIAMARRVEDRYASMGQFFQALEEYLRDESLRPTPPQTAHPETPTIIGLQSATGVSPRAHTSEVVLTDQSLLVTLAGNGPSRKARILYAALQIALAILLALVCYGAYFLTEAPR